MARTNDSIAPETPRDVGRRQALKLGLGMAAGAMVLSRGVAARAAAACALTPPQVEGPYYPIERQLDEDNDLTWVKEHSARAQGQLIYVQGRVMDAGCRPIADALVEIWQACSTGRYNHPGDTSSARLDPNFQYWGRDTSSADGSYLFKTIKPGAYIAGNDMRPPHIHFKVHRRGYMSLITQMYFAGERYNNTDSILQGLSRQEQARVVIEPEAPGREHDPRAQVFTFDLVLQS